MASDSDSSSGGGGDDSGASGVFARLRERMVVEQIASRGVQNKAVLNAMRRVPRHEFVPEDYRESAYEDRPLPLGPDQTISQPYIVAYMIEQLDVHASHRVLEIGTGSGYQAAVLAELMEGRGRKLFSMDIDAGLVSQAQTTLERLGYSNINLRAGDGALGWPEQSPFDRIIIAAACSEVPRDLVNQLAPGGRMILPLGDVSQTLILFDKQDGTLTSRELGGVRFVPMKGFCS